MRRVKFVVFVLFALFAIKANVYAAYTGFDVYPVDSEGSFTEVHDFGWNETPWIHIELPTDDMTYSVTWWHPEGTADYYSASGYSEGTRYVWHSLSNWDDVRRPGKWLVRADISSPHYPPNMKETYFNVAPEPFGVLLVLIGGVFLTLKRKFI